VLLGIAGGIDSSKWKLFYAYFDSASITGTTSYVLIQSLKLVTAVSLLRVHAM